MKVDKNIENIVCDAVKKHGNHRHELLPILQTIVEKKFYLSTELMREVAKQLDISAAEVHGVASFFTFLPITKRGQYTIKVCKTISCEMKDRGSIINTIKELLQIDLGETTADNKFSLVEVNCIGQCDKAPAMLVNDIPYTNLNPCRAREIIDSFRRDNPVSPEKLKC